MNIEGWKPLVGEGFKWGSSNGNGSRFSQRVIGRREYGSRRDLDAKGGLLEPGPRHILLTILATVRGLL